MVTSPAPLELSKHAMKDLQKAYKQERDRRLADRIQGIMVFAEGMALKAIRQILFVGVKTLKKWIETFRTQGVEGLLKWGYTGQSGQLTDDQWADVERELVFFQDLADGFVPRTSPSGQCGRGRPRYNVHSSMKP